MGWTLMVVLPSLIEGQLAAWAAATGMSGRSTATGQWLRRISVRLTEPKVTDASRPLPRGAEDDQGRLARAAGKFLDRSPSTRCSVTATSG